MEEAKSTKIKANERDKGGGVGRQEVIPKGTVIFRKIIIILKL